MKEVYFTAWPFSKRHVLRWPVARAPIIAVDVEAVALGAIM